MRLLTYEAGGERRLGALRREDIVDLQHWDSRGGVSVPATMLELIEAGERGLDAARGALAAVPVDAPVGSPGVLALARTRVTAPIPTPRRNVICLGRNYREHALESAAARGTEGLLPEHPVYFTKATTSVSGPFDPIPYDPELSTQIDWEVELGVVIGLGGKRVREDDVFEHVFGYVVVNDVTARDLQNLHGQWHLGKSPDGFCPMGPWIVTADEIPDPHNLRVTLRVNGVTKQDSNSSKLIFNVNACVSVYSRGTTLLPGDIFATGTPEGVGFARKPPEFLKPGDVVEAEVEGIGVLRNTVQQAASPK
jgi:2-keto-4-pentenoate hydratase/2-oxohepta-3-ene-1,7-dioic acid hydratase in catechol pathway